MLFTAKSNIVIPDGDVTVIDTGFGVEIFVSTFTIGSTFPCASVTVTGVILGGTFIVTPPISFMSSAVTTFISGVDVPV